MIRPSIAKGCVFFRASPPVDAWRTWAMNVVDVMWRASRAKAVSSYAASGCLSSTGVPSASKKPRPVPSGLRTLWATMLSGASSSQKRASTL